MRPINWQEIWTPQLHPLEIVIRSLIVYFFVQALFRLLGRKEWTHYGAFNIVVLFLIAVALRTTMLGNDSSVTSGIIAISTLFSVDWLFSYLSFRSELMADLLEGKLITLVKGGELQERAMRKTRVSKSRLLEQVRSEGHCSLDEIDTAYMERSGRISIQFKTR